jgi:sec-independent protein translocase protein TatC
MKKAKSATKRRQSRNPLLKSTHKQPFIEHVHELRRRLFYVGISVAIFSCGAYGIEHTIVDLLLKPADHQKFIYTSPGGGLDFLFRLCLYIGIACSIPVIVYQVLRYLEPLLHFATRRAVVWGSIASGILAAIGMVFGYFIGLPAALNFLLHQFVTQQIQPLLTIQSYMSFVSVYMLGSALLLQVPLILLIINRIKPLTPKKLLSFSIQRWVIVASVIGGAIMNPNPNPVALFLVSSPMILSYQVGVLIIWVLNRKHHRPAYVRTMLQNDSQTQAERMQTARSSKPLQVVPAAQASVARPKPAQVILSAAKPKLQPAQLAKPSTVSAAKPAAPARATRAPRSRSYVSDFAPRRSYQATMLPKPNDNMA